MIFGNLAYMIINFVSFECPQMVHSSLLPLSASSRELAVVKVVACDLSLYLEEVWMTLQRLRLAACTQQAALSPDHEHLS